MSVNSIWYTRGGESPVEEITMKNHVCSPHWSRLEASEERDVTDGSLRNGEETKTDWRLYDVCTELLNTDWSNRYLVTFGTR